MSLQEQYALGGCSLLPIIPGAPTLSELTWHNEEEHKTNTFLMREGMGHVGKL